MATSQRQRGLSGLKHDSIQQYLLYDAIDRSQALVFVADEEMTYLAVNQRACDVLGYTREELLSLRVTEIAIAVDAPTLYRQMMQERSQQGAVELRTKGGELLPFTYEASEVSVNGVRYWASVGFVDSDLFAKVGQLETALQSRIAIEQAKGVLMGRHGVDATTAFEALRRTARERQIRIHDLCLSVLEDSITAAEIQRHLPGDRGSARR